MVLDWVVGDGIELVRSLDRGMVDLIIERAGSEEVVGLITKGTGEKEGENIRRVGLKRRERACPGLEDEERNI